ncbi:hypothetical protein QCA50_001603 [Cerrena zonata]|uniref:RBR-type E3 ubiquitin transferase n=1 Tax=Cerrena zonata TaxID=2478898 RepID=A0AAW0GP28_9APHY
MAEQICSEEDLELCKTLRAEEFEVLESIYPDYISGDPSNGILRLEVPVELSEHHSLISVEDKILASLSTLPPLLLEIILPPNYPLYAPPQILSLHATHAWLPPSVSLQKLLLDMWQTGEGVIYSWIEWIRSGTFLEVLKYISIRDGKLFLRLPHPDLDLIVNKLTAFDSSKELERFTQHSYNCEICMTSIKGARCILLSCSHVFCRSCLVDFWGLCISEGDVGRVGCPDPQCVKDGREANEEEVRRVVTEEEVRRWKWLRQKQAMEKDPSIVHCPVSFCQAPVGKSQDAEEGSGWERLRECQDCGFSFCAYCKRTWHGAHSHCPLEVTDLLAEKYMASAEGSTERRAMELQYGANALKRMVVQYQESMENMKMIKESTTACPVCEVRIEKSHGCNHMKCFKCGNHFCYRCGGKLKPQDPYSHFNQPGTACYSKLFDLETVDNEWQPIEAFDMI